MSIIVMILIYHNYFNMATNSKISVLATSTPVLTTQFRTAVLSNYGIAGTIWLRVWETWDAVVWEGIPLAPASVAGGIGGSFSMDSDSLYQAPITAISSTGTNLLAVYYV